MTYNHNNHKKFKFIKTQKIIVNYKMKIFQTIRQKLILNTLNHNQLLIIYQKILMKIIVIMLLFQKTFHKIQKKIFKKIPKSLKIHMIVSKTKENRNIHNKKKAIIHKKKVNI